MAELNDYRQELKEKILELAMQEFSKHGIRDIKMDDIAHKLHISKRTLYEIYEDKESMLLEGMQRHKERTERELDAYARQPGVNVVDILARVFALQMESDSNVNPQFFADLHKCPRIMEYLEANRRRRDDRSREFMRRGIDEGLFRADVNYSLLIEIGHYLLETVMGHQLYGKYSMTDIVFNFPLVLIRGFCTEKGIALLDKALERKHW